MDTDKTKGDENGAGEDETGSAAEDAAPLDAPREFNGPKGPEPTRYGDWEQKGRCTDF